MIDMTSIRPPGTRFRAYRMPTETRALLAHGGMDPEEIERTLHDMGCGQMEACVRFSEALPARRAAVINGLLDGDGILLFDAVLDDGLTWSSGCGCSFLRTRAIPQAVAVQLEGRRLDEVLTHPAIDGGRTILSVTDHEDGSLSLVLSDHSVLRRATLRERWDSLTGAMRRRQTAAQRRAFGSRPVDHKWERPAPAIRPELPAVTVMAVAIAAVLTLAGRLLTGDWEIGYAVGVALVPAWILAAGCVGHVRDRLVLRHGEMPDRLDEIEPRLDAAVRDRLAGRRRRD